MRVSTPRRIGTIIFAVSWIVRIAIVLAGGYYLQPPSTDEPALIARSLAAGQGFSNPYGCVTGPTTHLAPVYPFLLSVMYRIFPPDESRQLAIYILSAIFVSLAYALLPWLAAKLRLDPRVGVLAGFAGALIPLFFWIEVTSEWEAGLSALLLIVALGMFADQFRELNVRKGVVTGVVLGATLLTAPTFLLVFAALSVVLVWSNRLRLPASLSSVAALWLPVVLMITPWTIRNYRVFHEFIPIRGNAGLQLHVSFNDLARATEEEGAVSGAFLDHPHTTQRACADFARFGEIAMNRRYQQEGMDWIRANPGRSARMILAHVVAFWRLTLPSRAKMMASEFIALCGLLGLGLCVRRRLFAGQVLGVLLLIYPLVYYVVQFDRRYRYPLYPFLLLLACLFLSEMVRKLRRHPDTKPLH